MSITALCVYAMALRFQSKYLVNVWWKFIAFLWFIAGYMYTHKSQISGWFPRQNEHSNSVFTWCASHEMHTHTQNHHENMCFTRSSHPTTMHIVCCRSICDCNTHKIWFMHFHCKCTTTHRQRKFIENVASCK